MMGRVAYAFPPCGKSKMTQGDILAWEHFYRVINRATSDKPKNRYLRFVDFSADILRIRPKPIFERFFTWILLLITIPSVALAGAWTYWGNRHPWSPNTTQAQQAWV